MSVLTTLLGYQSGFSGYSGVGTSGFSGYSGAVGTSGFSGTSGYSGISGYSGVGSAGTSGYSGIIGVYISPTPPGNTGILWLDTSTTGLAILPTGGTTGQVLTKTSNTDYVTAWTDLLNPFLLSGM